MKVKIDKEKCIGCGSCVAVCPNCFDLGDDTKAVLKNEGEVCDDNCDCLKEAVDICPIDAIEVEGD